MCEKQHYRPVENSSASECAPCEAVPGAICGTNPTIATLNLTAGYWRHSSATIETHYCRRSGSWTPCRGGANEGEEGDGYCESGYRGPRCELCDGPAYSRYFDKLEARCHDCGDMTARSVAMVCAMLLLVVLSTICGGESALLARIKDSDTCNAQLRFQR